MNFGKACQGLVAVLGLPIQQIIAGLFPSSRRGSCRTVARLGIQSLDMECPRFGTLLFPLVMRRVLRNGGKEDTIHGPMYRVVRIWNRRIDLIEEANTGYLTQTTMLLL